MRAWQRWGLWLAIALALAIGWTWPLAPNLDDHLIGKAFDPDMQCGLWWPRAVASSLLALEDPFVRPELNWPTGQDVRMLVWNIGAQVLMLPIHALARPVAALNLATFAALLLNGLACGWAGWKATRDEAASVVAVAVGVCSAYAFWESGSGRPEQGLWAPIGVYLGAMIWLREEPGHRGALGLAAASLAMAGAVYWFYACFLGLATLAWALPRLREPRRVLEFVGIGALATVLVLPFLAPILVGFSQPDNAYGTMLETLDPVRQKMAGSLELPNALILGKTQDPARKVPLLLIPAALVALRWRSLRSPAAWTLLALLMALGPVAVGYRGTPLVVAGEPLELPAGLLEWLPGYERFWWPYRWLGVALPGLAVVLAGLVARLPRWRWPVAVGLSLGLAVEARVAWDNQGLTRERLVPVEMPRAFALMRRMEGDHPVLVYPLARLPNNMVVFQVWHDQPVDGGLAWDVGPELRGPEWEERASTIGLHRGLIQLQNGQPVTADFGDTGGFHYVLADVGRAPGGMAPLHKHLGKPEWTDGEWALFRTADGPPLVP